MTRRPYTVIFAWTANAEALADAAKAGDEDADKALWTMGQTAAWWLDDPARARCLLCERTASLDNWHMVGGVFNDDDDLRLTFYVCADCEPASRGELQMLVRAKMDRVMRAEILDDDDDDAGHA